MEEDKSFDEFYAKLKDIVNSAFNLEEIIPEPKIVRMVLKSLLERFHAKITAIEESKGIDKIPLTKLVIYRPMSWVCLGSGNRARVRTWH